jgi:hypothetical protein
MSTPEFIAEFRQLHERAKKGALTPVEKNRYVIARAQFERIVVIAQEIGHSGRTLRSTLRMSKLLKVEVKPNGGDAIKSSTIDVSSNGFAMLVSAGMVVGRTGTFALHLPKIGGGSEPVSGRCRVASSRTQSGLFRVSFHIVELSPDNQQRLDFALIDAVLERFDPTLARTTR